MEDFIAHIVRNYDPGVILINCLYSLSRVLVGVLIAVVFGVVIGLFRSSLPKRVKKLKIVKFLFDAPKFPPPIAWIPLVVLWFGIGEIPAYTIVFIGAFSPIFTSTYEGAERVPTVVCDTARSMEVTGWKYLWLIVFPYCLPQIFTGIRNGVGMGWMSVIGAEMISGQSGLGYSIMLNDLNLQYDLVILDMVLIGIIGFFLFDRTVYLEKRIISWNDKTLT